MERRAGTEGNAGQQSTRRAQDRESVSQALERVRQAAKQRRKERFTALFHHINSAMLRTAFFALKRDAAAGVDGVTWQDYEADLDRRIEDLSDRVHRGAYRAQPSRRRYIPKPDGWQRPLAVAALEDKVVQRATTALLNAIYEEEFLGFSYGFRPGRGQHDALDALHVGIDSRKVNHILDADIAGFFDAVSQDWLIRFVEHRIGDPRIIRLIRKWLKAGVLEDGVVTTSERGTGQGSVISPLLANIYLHHVFDLWAARWRRREATGDMVIVRYADDIVVGFEHEADGRRFLDMMRERLAEFALTLHPEKTRLITFGRSAAAQRAKLGLGKPETFDFLGFTHSSTMHPGAGGQIQLADLQVSNDGGMVGRIFFSGSICGVWADFIGHAVGSSVMMSMAVGSCGITQVAMHWQGTAWVPEQGRRRSLPISSLIAPRPSGTRPKEAALAH